MSGKTGKRRRYCCGALLLAAAFLAGGCGAADKPSAGEKEKESGLPEKSVLRVSAGTGSGSAVLKEADSGGERILLLTAEHVLEGLSDGEMPVVVFDDGSERTCDGYVRADGIDMAILYLSDAELAEKLEEENCFIRADRERFDKLKDGTPCIAIGGGSGEGKAVCTGEIFDNWMYMSDYEQYMIWADVEIHPGMSGGGLFDSEGYFVGLLSGGSEDGQLAAVPLSLILSEWQELIDKF